MDRQFSSRKVRILRDEVSRKIAAGEVIDRPFSIVRELLDNSIDAGAGSVEVRLDGGGLGRIRVVDDGCGMSREDLELCWLSHATSKIENEDDLLKVSSLGFRGEALSSVAVCSRLEIVSCAEGEKGATRLLVRGGSPQALDTCQGKPGTVVEVSELFYNYPARRKFLRGVSAEAALCRSTFVDHAVAHPGVEMRLFLDGSLKLAFPRATGAIPLLERVSLAYGHLADPRLLGHAAEKGDGFTVDLVAGAPEERRRDRKLLQVFVNRRRVFEFSLVQAVEYGYSGFMPGGYYPVAFVFVEIDPSLIDFNIHPTKKEVRFRNLPPVHKAVVAAATHLLQRLAGGASTGHAAAAPSSQATRQGALDLGSPQPGKDRSQYRPENLPKDRPQGALLSSWKDMRRLAAEAAPSGERQGGSGPDEAQREGIRYLGQVFGVFLVFELSDALMLLDQHAAHERLIFEQLEREGMEAQELLFPVSFDVSEQEEERILRSLGELAEIGIVVRKAGSRLFEVTAVPRELQEMGETELSEIVRGAGVGGEEWKRNARASAACHLAIKEGEPVDPATARELCARSLALKTPRCPHGRPIWHVLPRGELYRLVDRPLD